MISGSSQTEHFSEVAAILQGQKEMRDNIDYYATTGATLSYLAAQILFRYRYRCNGNPGNITLNYCSMKISAGGSQFANLVSGVE